MCTPSALETALRSCIRKGTGNCTAIAVAGMPYEAPCSGDCISQPIATRIAASIVSGKLQINTAVFGSEVGLVTCATLVGFEEAVHSLLCGVADGTNTVSGIIDLGWDATCVPPSCGDRSLLELFYNSMTTSTDTPARIRVVENNDVFDPLDCIGSLLPLDTLLRMAVVELPGGLVAWRIQSEA